MIKNKYNLLDETVIRTPLLPFQSIENINSVETLKAFFKNEVNKEALYVSSERLYDEYLRWVSFDNLAKDEENRLIASLMKYALRMGGRSTPFGLSAGVNVLDSSNYTSIEPVEDLTKKVKKKTRLDMNLVYVLSREIQSDRQLREYLWYRSNTTLDVRSQFYRYVEYKFASGKRMHEVVQLKKFEELDAIIQLTSKGVVSFGDLVSIIVEKGYSKEDSTEFVHHIIDTQILVTSFEPTVTGEDSFKYLLLKLEALVDKNPKLMEGKAITLLNSFRRIDEIVREIDKKTGNHEVFGLYQEVKNLCKENNIEYSEDFFQVDSKFEFSENKLNKKLQYNLLKGIEFAKFFAKPVELSLLDVFKDRFTSRYQDKKVPLLEVLDPESGIGFGDTRRNYQTSNLISGLSLNRKSGTSKIDWRLVDSILLMKYQEAIHKGEKEIVFDDRDVEGLPIDELSLPDSFSSMYSLFKEKGEEKIELLTSGGNSGTQLIGRFTNLDNGIDNIAQSLCNKEQELNENKILAEIVHLPEARIGNILYRAPLRQYEIEYLGNSILDNEYKISVADLDMFVKNQRLILWSRKLNKEVVPKLGSAHNYSNNSLPVYHFLCSLSSQYSRTNLNFKFTSLSNELKFIPRISYKNVVIQPMTWRFAGDDFKKGFDYKSVSKDNQFISWIDENEISDKVFLVEGDNKLYFDLKNLLHQFVFKNEIKKKSVFTITESLVNSDSSIIRNSNGGFHNQILSFFYKKDKNYNFLNHKKSDVKEQYLPGSEWLYLKVYCGPKEADKLIVEGLNSFCTEMKNEKLIEKWFFIRYNDEFPHIRLRLRCFDKASYGEALTRIYTQVFESNKWEVADVCIDSYKRETNRYGSHTMEMTESFFYYDSKLISSVIEKDRVSDSDNFRWISGAYIVDCMLNDFGLDNTEKEVLLKHLSDGFLREFGGNNNLKKQLGLKYREFKEEMLDFFDRPHIDKGLLEERSIFTRGVAVSILDSLESEGIFKLDYLASLIHMTLNRLFDANPRENELVLYFLLHKQYKSEIHRKVNKEMNFVS